MCNIRSLVDGLFLTTKKQVDRSSKCLLLHPPLTVQTQEMTAPCFLESCRQNMSCSAARFTSFGGNYTITTTTDLRLPPLLGTIYCAPNGLLTGPVFYNAFYDQFFIGGRVYMKHSRGSLAKL